jgi:solute:Na+ symporter, SSS family
MTKLSQYDYWVIGFYFVYMAIIGWVCRKFIRNTSDYFRGGGKMLWWMVGSSAFMVSFSAWTFTGAAGKAFEDGPVVMVIFLGNALGFFFNYLLFAQRFRQMRAVTALQAVRARFGAGNEQFFTWLQIPLGVLYAGIWLNALSVFLAAALGFDLRQTIIVTGVVVLIMAVVGGSWAVVAGDFVQMLILMPAAIVAAFLAISHVGGWSTFVSRLPSHYFNWSEVARSEIIWLWIIAVVIQKFVSTNNLLEASRYLNAKDGREARWAGMLGCVLFLVGPVVWFIPPMVARITHGDLATLFPHLKQPSEAAYVATCLDTMPAGMVGLIISGIFAATMSSMDAGLNKNAGFFVKNFYHVVVRPTAKDSEQLLVSKIATLIMGLLVILAALKFSTLKSLKLFDLMLQFGALVALPYSVPLVWGVLIKRAPAWAGWSTVLVGFATSLWASQYLTPQWLSGVMGGGELNSREGADWTMLCGVLLNTLVGSAWFLGCCLFHRKRSEAERKRVDEFFTQMKTPVDFQKEIGEDNDAQQCELLGLLCLIYGGFVALLVLIPNPLGGRMALLACAGMVLIVGALLHLKARKLKKIKS